MFQMSDTPMQKINNEVSGLNRHRQDSGQGPGIPGLKSERKPWEGLSSLISVTASGWSKSK